MKRWAYLAIFLVLLLSHSGAVFAQSNEVSLASELTLHLNQAGDGSAFQQVTFSGVGKTLGKVTIKLPFKKVGGVVAAYSDGVKIPAKVVDEGSRTSTLQLTLNRAPRGNSYQTIIEYDVPQAMNKLKQIQIPNVSQSQSVKSNVVRVVMSLSAGAVTSLGSAPQKEGISVGSQEFVFNLKPEDSGIVLSAARDISYSLKLAQTIHNKSLLPKRVQLILPPDLHNQKVIYKNIAPQPKEMRLDEEGNVIAQYLLWPRQSKEVNVTLDVSVSKLQYDFSKVQPLERLPEELTEKYTSNSGVWRTTDALNQFVAKATKESQTSPIKIVENIHNEIIKRLEPSETSRRLPVEQVLTRDEAHSHFEYSDLMVAALRSQDIPARLIVGQRYDPGASEQPLTFYSWAEAYMPGVGWVAVDPFFGEGTDTFGSSDVAKIGLFVGADNGTLQSAVTGTDTYSERSIEVTEAKNELVRGESEVKISGTKFMILPGISLIKSDVQIISGVAVDNLVTTITNGNQGLTYLGSLAPFESRSDLKWAFLKDSFTDSKVTVGFGDSTEISEEYDSSQTPLNYLLMIAVLGLLALLGGGIYWLRRRNKVRVRHVEDSGDSVEQADMLNKNKAAGRAQKNDSKTSDSAAENREAKDASSENPIQEASQKSKNSDSE